MSNRRADMAAADDTRALVEQAYRLIGKAYVPARAGAAELLDGAGYATSTTSGARSSSQPSDPTAGAAIAGLGRTQQIFDDLQDRLDEFAAAANEFITVMQYAEAAGLTGRAATICSWCGREPTGIHPDVGLENGVCIRHRCVDCAVIPTGEGEDRLKEGRCPKCYMRRWREAKKAAEQGSGT